jgi:hypothetical protein
MQKAAVDAARNVLKAIQADMRAQGIAIDPALADLDQVPLDPEVAEFMASLASEPDVDHGVMKSIHILVSVSLWKDTVLQWMDAGQMLEGLDLSACDLNADDVTKVSIYTVF